MIRLWGVVVAGLCVAGCSVDASGGSDSRVGSRADSHASTPAPAMTRTPAPAPKAQSSAQSPMQEHGRSLAGDGRARRATMTIPAIGVHRLAVLPYRGSPDDAAGTRIQNGGVAASPGGPRGGVGPGGVGNYLVTAHRTSSTRAFERVPELRRGDRVQVTVGTRAAATRYTYEIVRTQSTSFRSQASLRRQSAPVPGRPGIAPVRAMITLSTCATAEDHARGNYWADEFGNPEHRIDKIGRLVARTSP